MSATGEAGASRRGGGTYRKEAITTIATSSATACVRKAAPAPIACSSAPPVSGPSIRATALVPMSTAKARPTISRGTTSPIMARRTGNSVVQKMPVRKVPTARCQYSTRPEMTSTASAAEITESAAKVTTSMLWRDMRSESIPSGSASTMRGAMRKKKSSPTWNADPVRS